MELERSHVKRFVLQTPNSGNENPAEVITMDTIEDWVSTFVRPSRNDPTSNYIEIKRNFSSDITHAGFIHYLHLCWAQEIGCELRPDMLYYTIISEVASQILKNPEQYVHLFSGSQIKSNIVVFEQDDIVTADRLVEAIRNIVKSPEFLSTICDVKFDSDVSDAHYARKMVFANMGTPFYNYIGSKCGIPHIDLVGSLEDWNKLYSSIMKLSTFLIDSKSLNKYFKVVSNIVANIIAYNFNIEMKSYYFTKIGNSPYDFFNDFFHYGRNVKCRSGHPENIVNGWAKLFYIHEQGEIDLLNFPSHVNYVPFTLDYSDKYFCQAVTLAYSELDKSKNTLRPGYGIITYEITNKDVYNKLANPIRTDQHCY